MNRYLTAVLIGCLLGGCARLERMWSKPGGPEIVSDQVDLVDSETPLESEASVSQAESADEPAKAIKADDDPYAGYELIGEPEVIEAVALTIDEEVITVNDLFVKIRKELTAAGVTGDKKTFVAEAGRLISEEIQRQVGQTLVYNQAVKSMHEAETAYVDNQVAEQLRDMIIEAGGSRAHLVAKLRAEDIELDQALETLRRQLVTRFYMHRMLTPRLNVSRKDLWQYYRTHRDEFSRPARVKMQVMAFPDKVFMDAHTPDARENARRLARMGAAAALERIRTGDDFGKVVREEAVSSQYRSGKGGVWDFMEAGSFREVAVEEKAFHQAPGEVSDLIEGETGVFVVKTLELETANKISFEEAQPDIDAKLRDRLYYQLSGEYYQKLQKRAVIQHGEAFEKFALARALQVYYRGDAK